MCSIETVSKSKVHIVQLLCPSRHCIMAVGYHPDNGSSAEAIEMLRGVIEKLKLNPWCGICGSPDLKFEDSPTVFDTMIEAAPSLAYSAMKQAITSVVSASSMKNN
jgi:hypothetical protein